MRSISVGAHAGACACLWGVCVRSVCSCAHVGARLTCAHMSPAQERACGRTTHMRAHEPHTGATIYKFVSYAVGGGGKSKER